MKVQSFATQIGLQCQSNRILSQAKQETTECDQKEERAIGSGIRMMYQRLIASSNLILEFQTKIEVQMRSQIRGGSNGWFTIVD
jgi:hypothetical protein